MSALLWLFGKAFLAALILTPIFRDIFRSYNVVDRPAHRKVHAYPTPRVGGIPIAIAYAVALISFGEPGHQWAADAPGPLTIIPGAAIAFAVGLLDDFFNLRPLNKLIGLVAAASVAFWSGLRLDLIGGHQVSIWLAYPLTVFWLLLTSNALNLIDGLDGLCAGMGLFATLTLFSAALLSGNLPLAYVTFPMAGALLGFLCYNLNPATIFLGDSGALLIGFLLGCYGLFWTQKTSTLLSIAVPLLALSIPLLDVSLSVIRRFLGNRPIFTGDRGHIHHRLLARGMSPRKAVGVLYLAAMLAAVFALAVISMKRGPYQGLLTVTFCIAAWVGIRQLRYTEFDIVGRLLFGGDFYRTLQFRMRLTQLAAALEQAATEEAWWTALAGGARELGLVSVGWERPEESRKEVLVEGATPAWSFRIALSEAECVLVEGTSLPAPAALDLPALAETIRRAAPEKAAAASR